MKTVRTNVAAIDMVAERKRALNGENGLAKSMSGRFRFACFFEKEKALNYVGVFEKTCVFRRVRVVGKVRVRTGERAPDDRENAFPLRIGGGR